MQDRAYHHGDLRAALLAAAEEELAAAGAARFSLRAVAKRAGVSHAAPAHHFGGVDGLLDALAAESFRRFDAAMRAEIARRGDDPVGRLVGAGLGYIAYSTAHPEMFDLQFARARRAPKDDEFAAAGRAAFGTLSAHVAQLVDIDTPRGKDALAQVWAVAHGMAELFSRREGPLMGPPSPERTAAFERILRRTIEAACG